jgi:hypothetical protein
MEQLSIQQLPAPKGEFCETIIFKTHHQYGYELILAL